MSTCSRGSNGACEIASRTVGRSHDGANDLTEGNFLCTPFINRHTRGCWPTMWSSKPIWQAKIAGKLTFQVEKALPFFRLNPCCPHPQLYLYWDLVGRALALLILSFTFWGRPTAVRLDFSVAKHKEPVSLGDACLHHHFRFPADHIGAGTCPPTNASITFRVDNCSKASWTGEEASASIYWYHKMSHMATRIKAKAGARRQLSGSVPTAWVTRCC